MTKEQRKNLGVFIFNGAAMLIAAIWMYNTDSPVFPSILTIANAACFIYGFFKFVGGD